MWPIKVVHDLRWTTEEGGARTVEVTPGGLAFETIEGEGTLRTELFACRERRGLVIGFDLDAPSPLEVDISFRCDFRPMWPAGMGGQIGTRDEETGAFLLTEERGRFATLLGGPTTRLVEGGGDHALPPEPVRMRLTVEPGTRALFVIAGAELEPPPLSEEARLGLAQSATGFARAEAVIAAAREQWHALVAGWEGEREIVDAHWSRFLTDTTSFSCSDPRHTEAFLWAKIAIERAWVSVDGLGRGLVAGLAPSRGSERPGYGWFFDGDALIASRAMSGVGDFAGVREVLRFAASHQRDDGKLMHELTLSARLCNWLEDYPYAYYKGLNAADFVISLERYLRASGDLDLARELWDNVTAALGWCERCTDDEGRMTNRQAGIAAVEAGPLSDAIESEVFLNGAWIGALRAGASIAERLGRDEATHYRELLARAEAGFEGFASPDSGLYGFALLEHDARCDDHSAYLGYPLALGCGEAARARASAMRLNDPALTADWGARMFAVDSAIYDPAHYNTGAVFPFLTSYVTLALFHHALLPAAHQVHDSQVALTGFGGLGMIEEHLGGDRAEVPGRGVPHQIFSSYAIPEGTLRGGFGIELDATNARLDLRPALPPHWSDASLANLRVGETRCDVTVTRVRAPDRPSRWRIEVTRREGPPLTVGLAPLLPPLSVVRSARANGAELAIDVEVRPSGALEARFADRELHQSLIYEFEAEEGPDLHLPGRLPPRGEASENPRLVEQSLESDTVVWRLAGLAGTHHSFALRCDFPINVEGDTLEVDFPAGPAGSFTVAEVRITRC